ncbi:MAG: hypothetical protein IID07_16220 [Gemmatimonadetes bacterium]|nr:hypothetical protein [Gemmatimonadota bacterium]
MSATGGDGRIYVIGGKTSAYTNTVVAYDTDTDMWAPVTGMGTPRFAPSVATGADGKIYVIGGFDGTSVLATGEVYDPAANSWSPIADAPLAFEAGTAATGPDGRIYIMGGINDGTLYDQAHAYDPATDTWTTLASMPFAQYGPGAVTGADGHIYVTGGYRGFYSKQLLIYDIVANTWTEGPSSAESHYTSQAVLVPGGKIVVAGGHNGGAGPTRTTETYQTIGPITVDIDIKPGSDKNPINPKSRGLIPVVILTTGDFDATTVDASTVTFGPGRALEAHGKGHLEDVDGDEFLDMVLHFRTQETGISCGDTEVSLEGKTTGGEDIEGSDSVSVKCR